MKIQLSPELKYFWKLRYNIDPSDDFDIIDAVSHIQKSELVFISVCIILNMESPNEPRWSVSVVKDNNLLYQNLGYISQENAYSDGLLNYFKTIKTK